MTIDDIIKTLYNPYYKYLTPSKDSVKFAELLWAHWENSCLSKPDIEHITKSVFRYQDDFFKEIVLMACKMLNIPYASIRIEYSPYLLDYYNLSTLQANDGYLVIVDDTFLIMLYNITNILMFEVNNLIEDIEEDIYKFLFKQLISEYIERKSFKPHFRKEISRIDELLHRSYNVTEYAVYLFNSIKIFLFAHEVGHCLLEHSEEHIVKMLPQDNGNISDKSTDNFSQEFEADIFGYRLFMEIMNTTDDTIDVTFLKYRYEYAPLLLFDLFINIENILCLNFTNNTHPSPTDRKTNLLKHFQIKEDDVLYSNLKQALCYMMG